MIDLNVIKPENLWYVIGLVTSDGNLSKDLRHISITSKDESLLLDVRNALGLTNKITLKTRSYEPEKKYFFLQFGDVKCYRFLESLGLVPNKSLILGKLLVPDVFFHDFLRGVIDGDGCIYSWKHHTNNYTQWSLRIACAAPNFIYWLKYQTEVLFKVQGKLYKHTNAGNGIYNLKFGKLAAKVILKQCYYEGCLCLDRKLKIATDCLNSVNGFKKYGKVVSN